MGTWPDERCRVRDSTARPGAPPGLSEGLGGPVCSLAGPVSPWSHAYCRADTSDCVTSVLAPAFAFQPGVQMSEPDRATENAGPCSEGRLGSRRAFSQGQAFRRVAPSRS